MLISSLTYPTTSEFNVSVAARPRPHSIGVVPPRPGARSAPLVSAAPPSLVEYGTHRILVVAGVMLAALLQTVDLTIVNVALPTIQGNLGATVDEATWVLTGYVVANVVVIPLTPWLQLRFGRKKYFLVSIAGFTLASVLCGMASSLTALILFRIVQGAFGGGLLATAQVVLRDTFPQKQIGLSQSIFALGTILGPSLGPTLGGVLVDNLSWPWVFDVNVVPGILAIVILWRYMRDNGRGRRESVDVTGIALLIVAVSCMQYVLDQGQHDDWFSNQTIVVCTFVCVAATAVFVWWELRVAQPIVDLRVLGSPPVAAALAIAGAYAAVIFPSLLLLPQFTVENLGFTSTLAGFLIGARALPVLFLTIPVGRLTNLPWLDLRWLRIALARPRRHHRQRSDDVRRAAARHRHGRRVRLLTAAGRHDARRRARRRRESQFVHRALLPAGRLDIVGWNRRAPRPARAVPSGDARRAGHALASAGHAVLTAWFAGAAGRTGQRSGGGARVRRYVLRHRRARAADHARGPALSAPQGLTSIGRDTRRGSGPPPDLSCGQWLK
jgi:MFS family permease